MVQVAALILTACLVAILVGRSSASMHWLLLAAAAVLIYLLSVVSWWGMLYFHVVSFDSVLARFAIHRTTGLIGGLIYFAPPLLPVLVAGVAYQRRR